MAVLNLPWELGKGAVSTGMDIYYYLNSIQEVINMASIQKRKSKNGEVSWQLTFELGIDPVTEKRIRKYETVKGTKNRRWL